MEMRLGDVMLLGSHVRKGSDASCLPWDTLGSEQLQKEFAPSYTGEQNSCQCPLVSEKTLAWLFPNLGRPTFCM